MTNKIFAIRRKGSKELAVFEGKCGWDDMHKAARDFQQARRKWVYTGKHSGKIKGWEWQHNEHFSKQDEYEMVEINQFVKQSEIVCSVYKVRSAKVEEFSVIKGA